MDFGNLLSRFGQWLFDNREWVFSGIGVFGLGLVWTALSRKKNGGGSSETTKTKANSGGVVVQAEQVHIGTLQTSPSPTPVSTVPPVATPAIAGSPSVASAPLPHRLRANRFFVGREAQLRETHERLFPAPGVGRGSGAVVALTGLGGVGKSSLAREYAEGNKTEYEYRAWVQADRPLATEFAQLALDLGVIPEASGNAEEDGRRALAELCAEKRRLLIFDNAPDAKAIREWLPEGGECHVLVTSRFSHWGADVAEIKVGALEAEKAREFLLIRTGQAESEAVDADRLAKEVEYLPLALEQAAAYIAETKGSFAGYLELYGKHRAEMLKRRPADADYSESVATTWLTTVEGLGPVARVILRLAAFLSPEDIPRDLLDEAREVVEKCVREVRGEAGGELTALEVDEALAELARYSMITLEDAAFSVHRLVQAVERDGLDEGVQRRWAEWAVEALNTAFPGFEFGDWSRCALLLPHALTCAEYVGGFGIVSWQTARLLQGIGCYLHRRGQYPQSESLHRQALEIWRAAVGEEHTAFATSCNEVGSLCHLQGRNEEAEQLLQQATKIYKAILGEDHPWLASSLSNLASVYQTRGKYEEAETLFRHAVEIDRVAMGEEHPTFARNLNNLAALYQEQGKYVEAEPLLRQALEIRRAALSEDHPELGSSLNNLAALYRAQGRYNEAEPLLLQTMELLRQAVGEEHPHYIIVRRNLEGLRREMGKDEEGE